MVVVTGGGALVGGGAEAGRAAPATGTTADSVAAADGDRCRCTTTVTECAVGGVGTALAVVVDGAGLDAVAASPAIPATRSPLADRTAPVVRTRAATAGRGRFLR